METKSQRPKGRENAVFLLNAAIEAMNLAEKVSSITPATAVFSIVGFLLTTIKVHFLLLCDEMSQIHARPGIDG